MDSQYWTLESAAVLAQLVDSWRVLHSSFFFLFFLNKENGAYCYLNQTYVIKVIKGIFAVVLISCSSSLQLDLCFWCKLPIYDEKYRRNKLNLLGLSST